jgi:hypothetical protein
MNCFCFPLILFVQSWSRIFQNSVKYFITPTEVINPHKTLPLSIFKLAKNKEKFEHAQQDFVRKAFNRTRDSISLAHFALLVIRGWIA